MDKKSSDMETKSINTLEIIDVIQHDDTLLCITNVGDGRIKAQNLYNSLYFSEINLINNSFFFKPKGWNGGWDENGGGFEIDTNNLFNGKPTLKTTVGMGIRHDWIKLETNTVYTYSAMVLSSENFTGVFDKPLHYHAGVDNTYSNTKLRTISYDNTLRAGVWKLLHLTFKLIDDANSFRPHIFLGSNSTAVFNIAFTGLVKGYKPLSSAALSMSDILALNLR